MSRRSGAFNRFYTRKLGVLDQQLLKSPFSLSEARVLYELAHRDDAAAKEIGIELGSIPAISAESFEKFDDDGLISRKPLASDRRQHRARADRQGAPGLRQARAQLAATRSAAMLAALPHGDGERLVAAMATIERLLGTERRAAAGHPARPPPGDMGWVVQSHGALYAARIRFELLVRGDGRRRSRRNS